MKTVIFYSHLRDVPNPILRASVQSIVKAHQAASCDIELLAILPTKLNAYGLFNDWQIIEARGDKGLHDCYVKIMAGLEAAMGDVIYLTEHDVLYPLTYFDDELPDPNRFCYNTNIYRLNTHGFFWHGKPLTSQCVANKEMLKDCYTMRLAWIFEGRRIVWDEPGGMDEIAPMYEYQNENPAIDIRHGGNLTGMRTAEKYDRDVYPWGSSDELWAKWGQETAEGEAGE